jgi:hypothetical protein
MINDGLPLEERLSRLNQIAIQQREILLRDGTVKRLGGVMPEDQPSPAKGISEAGPEQLDE